MSGGHYHPENSKVSENALSEFVRAPLSGVILDVPGIGPSTAELLKVCVSTAMPLFQDSIRQL